MGSQLSPNGFLTPWSTWGRYNNIAFAIQQAISKLQTVTLVKVQSCSNDGDLSPVGTVDVVPLVNQVDASGNPTPHVTIYNVPYLRIQGGINAIILDPQPGDIGIAVFASRDISKVKSTLAQANPGSARQFDFSDALYLGGVLNGLPQQYIQFDSEGITITSSTAITLKAPTINLEGNISQTDGTITAQTDVKAGPNNISLVNHVHTSESPGNPTSPPLP